MSAVRRLRPSMPPLFRFHARFGLLGLLSVLVCWACFMYARIWCTNRPETIVEKNDLGAKGGGGLRRRGQASGGRHTHGGQCGKMGPPQRVWGNSGGDSRRCDTQGRPSAEEANARSAGGRASASTSAEESDARSAGGRASASTSAKGAHARSARGRAICEHQRRRSECKECGGPSLCQHQRQRSRCKECGGASLCQHQRQRSRCKECGGASLWPAPARKEPMQGVRGGERSPCTGRRRSATRLCSRCRHRWCPETRAAAPLPAHMRYCRSWRAKIAAVHRCCRGPSAGSGLVLQGVSAQKWRWGAPSRQRRAP